MRTLAQKVFSNLAPHERLRLGVGYQIISTLFNDALVKLVQVQMSGAYFGDWIKVLDRAMTRKWISMGFSTTRDYATYPLFS